MASFPPAHVRSVADDALDPASNQGRTMAVVRPIDIKPLIAARARAAAILDAVLRARTESGDYSASNCALANSLDVAEKQLRRYRSGERALPFDALFALPQTIARDLLTAASAILRPRDSTVRSPDSHVRRISMMSGELSGLMEQVTSSATRSAAPEHRRALQLAASRLAAEAESLIARLSEES